jgi:hypothetical protein
MEDKRGTKRAHSPFREVSPSSDGAKTPPLIPSGSPPPLTFPLEFSSRCPLSLMFEQGGSSGKAPVVVLSSSSNEGDLIADVSRDEAFARRLFGDLNRDVLGSPNDGKIIILNDSNKEEDVCEEKAVDAEVVTSSAVRSVASTASTTDANKSNTPDQATDGYSSSGDEAGLP